MTLSNIHEWLHRTLKIEAASPSAATPRALQADLSRFRREYNHERPHATPNHRPRPTATPRRPVATRRAFATSRPGSDPSAPTTGGLTVARTAKTRGTSMRSR